MAETLYKDLNQFSSTNREYYTDARAVYQGVVNILNTRTGERIFRPNFGIDLDSYLFETLSGVSQPSILNAIGAAVEAFDNRVAVDYSKSEVRLDSDNNALELKLIFQIVGIAQETFQVIEAIRL